MSHVYSVMRSSEWLSVSELFHRAVMRLQIQFVDNLRLLHKDLPFNSLKIAVLQLSQHPLRYIETVS